MLSGVSLLGHSKAWGMLHSYGTVRATGMLNIYLMVDSGMQSMLNTSTC